MGRIKVDVLRCNSDSYALALPKFAGKAARYISDCRMRMENKNWVGHSPCRVQTREAPSDLGHRTPCGLCPNAEDQNTMEWAWAVESILWSS